MILLQLLLASNIAMAAEPLGKLQWVLKNTGENKSLELDHITTYRVQGRAGEDLKIPASLKKSPKKVIVAILDTGIDHTHPDLKNVLVRKDSECKAHAASYPFSLFRAGFGRYVVFGQSASPGGDQERKVKFAPNVS